MASRKKRGPKKKRAAKPRKAKKVAPKPAPRFTPAEYNYYTNWVINVITGRLAEADVLMRRHGPDIRRMAAYLRQTLGLPELGTVYRGILLEPDEVPKDRMVQGHGPETGSSSWTDDPQVACWFADTSSVISGFVKQIRPRVRGWITETKPKPGEVLWHHSWEGRYPIPDIRLQQGTSLVRLAAFHPDLGPLRNQLEWALRTQKEVILSPFKRKVKLVPIEDFDCPPVQELDTRLALPGTDPLGGMGMFFMNPGRGDDRIRDLERRWRAGDQGAKAELNSIMIRSGRIPPPDYEKLEHWGYEDRRAIANTPDYYEWIYFPKHGAVKFHQRRWVLPGGRKVSVIYNAENPDPGWAIHPGSIPVEEHSSELVASTSPGFQIRFRRSNEDKYVLKALTEVLQAGEGEDPWIHHKRPFSNPPRCDYDKVEFSDYRGSQGKKRTALFTGPGRRRTVHFGARGYEDFTMHQDPARRDRYLERHGRGREDWDRCDTAGSLSRWVLWGDSTSRTRNERAFRRRFRLKNPMDPRRRGAERARRRGESLERLLIELARQGDVAGIVMLDGREEELLPTLYRLREQGHGGPSIATAHDVLVGFHLQGGFEGIELVALKPLGQDVPMVLYETRGDIAAEPHPKYPGALMFRAFPLGGGFEQRVPDQDVVAFGDLAKRLVEREAGGWRLARFGSEWYDGDTVEGYLFGSQRNGLRRWNGWASPLMTKKQVQRMIDMQREHGLDEETSLFFRGDTLVVRGPYYEEDGEEGEVQPRVVTGPGAPKEPLYDVSFGWTWDEEPEGSEDDE